MSVEELHTHILTPEFCNALPLHYGDLQSKIKNKSVSADLSSCAVKCLRPALIMMCICSALQTLQRGDAAEAMDFEKSRLKAHGLTLADLPLRVQEALQIASLQ